MIRLKNYKSLEVLFGTLFGSLIILLAVILFKEYNYSFVIDDILIIPTAILFSIAVLILVKILISLIFSYKIKYLKNKLIILPKLKGFIIFVNSEIISTFLCLIMSIFLIQSRNILLVHLGIYVCIYNLYFFLTSLIPTLNPRPNSFFKTILMIKSFDSKVSYYRYMLIKNSLRLKYKYEDMNKDLFIVNKKEINALDAYLQIEQMYFYYFIKDYDKAFNIISNLYLERYQFNDELIEIISLEYYFQTIIYNEDLGDAFEIYKTFSKQTKDKVKNSKSILHYRIRIVRALIVLKNYTNAVIEIKKLREILKFSSNNNKILIEERFLTIMEEKYLPLIIKKEEI